MQVRRAGSVAHVLLLLLDVVAREVSDVLVVRRVPQLQELLDDVRLRGRKAGKGGDEMSECR